MNLFVACDLNNGIGYKNQLLYRSSVDLKRFAEKTKNSTIVMGYNTFCSLPHVLPNRRHIVFTKKLIVPELELKVNHTIAKFGVCPEVHIVNSLESFFKLISDLKVLNGNDLKALEEKISQLVQLCKSLREDNTELRQSLALVQGAERDLKARMQQAQIRIESIMDRLPEDVL